MSLNQIFLPAEFKQDRIFVLPRTKDGIKLNFIIDTGGDMFVTPDGVNRANLVVSKIELDGQYYDVTALPEFDDNEWIPPLLIDGKSPNLAVIESEICNDGLLGQAWFADRVWTFDYLNQRLIYHRYWAGPLIKGEHCVTLGFIKDNKGSRKLNFPRIQAVIDNETINFLFDTGATLKLSAQALNELGDGLPDIRATSFITKHLFEKWRELHPDWKVIKNADGKFSLIEVPEIILAGFKVGPVWFTERPDENFHQFMSQWMDQQIDGALGGSAFKFFRITVDYSNAIAYFEC
ncbi:hypothetical protein [Gordoniibacillus kamchatkensis]|uniref:hypothetical protein n=1 Tax=Gordoniibacillus kamchatkensis TaxID=1590651 RepID=UPI000698208D|nr:hypothetical protein [Paenibacillus sp. VKM B-2647]